MAFFQNCFWWVIIATLPVVIVYQSKSKLCWVIRRNYVSLTFIIGERSKLTNWRRGSEPILKISEGHFKRRSRFRNNLSRASIIHYFVSSWQWQENISSKGSFVFTLCYRAWNTFTTPLSNSMATWLRLDAWLTVTGLSRSQTGVCMNSKLDRRIPRVCTRCIMVSLIFASMPHSWVWRSLSTYFYRIDMLRSTGVYIILN